MRVVSVQVGLPREVLSGGRSVRTGISKQPVQGRVLLRFLNLDGDAQADRSVHGGPQRAAYAYPREHYDFWRRELPGAELPWGSFGENFTTEGLSEQSVCIGDELRIGDAVVRATAPRLPCFKLGIKLGMPGIVGRFQASGRTGFYLMVVREGEVGAGDTIEVQSRDPRRVSVADMVRAHEHADPELARRLVQIDALPEGWRQHFQQVIAKQER